MSKYILGIDQGTTGVTAMLFDKDLAPISRGYCEIEQFYPQNGWVEHDPENIWESVKNAAAEAMKNANASVEDILAIGIDHEGESAMIWDKETGKPLYPAIVWQDKRTASRAEELKQSMAIFFVGKQLFHPTVISVRRR